MKKSILLSGCIILLSAAMATAQNYFAGTGSGTANTGSGCTGVGFQSIYSGNSGSFNTAVGFQSLFQIHPELTIRLLAVIPSDTMVPASPIPL